MSARARAAGSASSSIIMSVWKFEGSDENDAAEGEADRNGDEEESAVSDAGECGEGGVSRGAEYGKKGEYGCCADCNGSMDGRFDESREVK